MVILTCDSYLFIFKLRYKRLMFGISCAPETFQKVMDALVAGLEGVIVYLDDVMVWGSTQEQHDFRLKCLLDRFKEYNVLLNDNKCLYNVEELEFLGHYLSAAGVKPTESRVKAVEQFRRPENAAELRSFLGLITYVGRFIPHLASKTDSLRSLLKKDSKFQWDAVHQRAFEEIKQAVSNISYLGFFNPKDKTVLIADASPYGIGAVLMQENVHSQGRVIAYASKSLTDLERKYFQTEREALALVWAVDRFKLYLQGIKFELITDCKPLQFLFSPRSKPCARLERWILRLQSYTYKIVYQPGPTNLADALSRLSVSNEAAESFDPGNESFVRMLTTTSAPVAITVQEIQEASVKDEEIQDVIKALCNCEWTEKAKPYKAYDTELCVSSDVLLRGERIIIPGKMRRRTLELAHEGHPGMVVMKRRLRQKVWWPGMDAEVEQFVKACRDCTLVSSATAPEPLSRTAMPDKPWVHTAVDFMGPLPSGHNLLVIVDYYSRFVEVMVMKEISAKSTITALHETFCRYGIPETMKSDNGPQFVSEALQEFCREYGIEHRKTTPYWPQANGEVERANRALKKRLQISQTSRSDWKWDLRMYLLMYNSTPHSTTGVAPSALMFGRVLRDKLPGFPSVGMKPIEEVLDRDRQKKVKEAEYANIKRKAKPNPLKEGDVVVAKRMCKENKLASSFSPEELVVLDRSGSDVTVKSKESGKIFHRNVAHLKPIVPHLQDTEENQHEPEILQNQETSNRVDNQKLQLPVLSKERPRRETKRPDYLDDYLVRTVQDY